MTNFYLSMLIIIPVVSAIAFIVFFVKGYKKNKEIAIMVEGQLSQKTFEAIQTQAYVYQPMLDKSAPNDLKKNGLFSIVPRTNSNA